MLNKEFGDQETIEAMVGCNAYFNAGFKVLWNISVVQRF